MSLSDDVRNVVATVSTPNQIIKAVDEGSRVILPLPNLTVPTGSNQLIRDLFKGSASYDRFNNTIVANPQILEEKLRMKVIREAVEDLTNMLANYGISKRTKLSKWLSFNKRRFNDSDELGNNIYQIWKYLKTPDQQSWTTKSRNVTGLLDVVMNKYDGKI